MIILKMHDRELQHREADMPTRMLITLVIRIAFSRLGLRIPMKQHFGPTLTDPVVEFLLTQ